MKANKLANIPKAITSGTKLIEKYRWRMSRLTYAERQRLTARGIQIICGNK
jgi:hypothetical protein